MMTALRRRVATPKILAFSFFANFATSVMQVLYFRGASFADHIVACAAGVAAVGAAAIGGPLLASLGLRTGRQQLRGYAVSMVVFVVGGLSSYSGFVLWFLWVPMMRAIRAATNDESIAPVCAEVSLDAGLVLPPGSRVRWILGLVFSRRTMTCVFEPGLADMQAEWLDAIVAKDHPRAVWIRVRGYGYLAQHVVAQLPISFVRMLVEAWKASKL